VRAKTRAGQHRSTNGLIERITVADGFYASSSPSSDFKSWRGLEEKKVIGIAASTTCDIFRLTQNKLIIPNFSEAPHLQAPSLAPEQLSIVIISLAQIPGQDTMSLGICLLGNKTRKNIVRLEGNLMGSGSSRRCGTSCTVEKAYSLSSHSPVFGSYHILHARGK